MKTKLIATAIVTLAAIGQAYATQPDPAAETALRAVVAGKISVPAPVAAAGDTRDGVAAPAYDVFQHSKYAQ